MRKPRIVLPVAALFAASLIVCCGAGLAAQTTPETVTEILADLDRVPLDESARKAAAAQLSERLVSVVGNECRRLSPVDKDALLSRILTRLDTWDPATGPQTSDVFLHLLARDMAANERPSDALVLYELKLDRMLSRPIGTGLDDFFATLAEARQLPRSNYTLISKAFDYLKEKRFETITLSSPGQDERMTKRLKAEMAADALQNLGHSLVSEARSAQAISILMQANLLRSPYLDDNAPDSLLAKAAENARLLTEAWTTQKSPSAANLAGTYARQRVKRLRKLMERNRSDTKVIVEYGWALRALIRIDPHALDRGSHQSELESIVTNLMEQPGRPAEVYRLAVAYYDDRGSDAEDTEQELAYHKKALSIAMAEHQRVGGDLAIELDDITVSAMNVADTLKRIARDDKAADGARRSALKQEALQYYMIARNASDQDIVKNADDQTVVRHRLKLLDLQTVLAESLENFNIALEAIDTRIQLLEKRGFDLAKHLPDVLKQRESLARAASQSQRSGPAPLPNDR